MDRSHTPSVIQADVELREISASPSVELSHLLTPSLPEDKLQSEINLDFDGSCNAHDSVLGSSFPLCRETDVSMGEDECLDLSVTPSFETGLSDYAPNCFDSGTTTHSIHTHPVCAVSESVPNFIAKDANINRSQLESVANAQILNASPFILGSTSAASFVNAVFENLQSRSSSVLHPTLSIFSVAPGIFILNTLGTPGIIDLPVPLRTNPPSAGCCVSSAFQPAVTTCMTHNNVEVQSLQNTDSAKLNSFVTSNIIKLEIRTVPISEQFPVVTNDNSSTVLPTCVNLPISFTQEVFSENICSTSGYLSFDGNLMMPTSGVQANNEVQLADRNVSLEQSYCQVGRDGICGVVNSVGMQVQTEKQSESNIEDACSVVDQKPSQTSGCTNEEGKFDGVILESAMQGDITKDPCNDLHESSVVCSVESNLWSNVNRFCSYSGKTDTEATQNMAPLTTNAAFYNVKDMKQDNLTQDKNKSMETILNAASCNIIQDSPVQRSRIMTNFQTVVDKEKDLASLMSYMRNVQDMKIETDSCVERSSSQIGNGTNASVSVSASITEASSTTYDKEADADEDNVDDGLSEQLTWGGCSNSEILQPVTNVAKDPMQIKENVHIDSLYEENTKSRLNFLNDDNDLKPSVLDLTAHPNTTEERAGPKKVQVKVSTVGFSTLLHKQDDISTPFPSKVNSTVDENKKLMTCAVEKGGQDDQTNQEISEQDSEQNIECSVNECQLCNATFTRLGNYRRHLKLHDFKHWNNKRYKCEKCGRSFLQHCDLKRHVLIHENREPYKCSVCGKGYIRKSDLVVHLRFHNKEKAFKCDQCSKSYYQNGDLKRHLRTHTRQELLICAYCGRKLARQTTLLQHMQTKHKDIIIETFQSVEKHKQSEHSRMPCT